MADWFAHRLDAEEIAGDRIRRTGYIHVVRQAAKSKGGFYVIATARRAPPGSISEIKLVERKPVTYKTLIGTIDCTPSWVSILPMILVLLENGNAEGQLAAREELGRMARLADAYVAARAA